MYKHYFAELAVSACNTFMGTVWRDAICGQWNC